MKILGTSSITANNDKRLSYTQANYRSVFNTNSIGDTVSFGMSTKIKQVEPLTEELLAKLSNKLIKKNKNMSKGYAQLLDKDTQAQAYYDNDYRNLITSVNKLFSQSKDGQIVIFKQIFKDEKSNLFSIEALTPFENKYKQTIINIDGERVTAKCGEKATLSSITTNTKKIIIQTQDEVEQVNKTIQGYLNSFFTKGNTIF